MQEQNNTATSEISLGEVFHKFRSFLRYILSKWLPLLLITVAGGLAGITYSWLQKAKYEAVLSFSMEDDKPSVGGLAGIASQLGLDLGSVGGTFSGENILAFMHSDKMLESTLLSVCFINGKQQSLLNAYLDIYQMREGFKKSARKEIRDLQFPENTNVPAFSRLQDSVLLLVTNNIAKNIIKTVRPDQRLNLYTVSCTSTDENFSVEFCNRLVNNVSDFYTETKTKRSAKIVDILQKRADSIKLAYDNALLGRAELSDANINPALQTPVVGIQRKQTDATVLATAYGELLKNLEIAKFNLLKDAPLIQIIDTPMEPLEKKKLGRLLGGILGSFLAGFICLIYLGLKKTFSPT